MQKLKNYWVKIKNFKITRKFVLQTFLVLLLTCLFSLIYFNQATISLYLHNFSSLNKNTLQIFSMYVGQGDSSFVILPDKTSILIDTGTEEYADKFCGELSAIMENNGIEKIDYLFLTHPHSDHIGGAIKVFERFEVLDIFRPIICLPNENNPYGYDTTEDFLYIEVIEKAKEEGIVNFITPQEWQISSYTLKIWTPLSVSYSDLNDYSPVITLQNEENSLMFTGDLSIDGEEEFLELANEIDLDIDLLKVSHHGSQNATSAEFLQKIKPEVAIISAGVDNIYNFPNEELIERLKANGVQNIYSTNTLGTIGISLDNGLTIVASGFIFQDNAFLVTIYFILLFAIFSVREPYILKREKRYESFLQKKKI